MFKLDLEKAEEPEIKLPTSAVSLEMQESSQKTSISALLTMPKPLTVWITINWLIIKEMGIPDHLTCLLRNLYAGQEATVRTGHGTTKRSEVGQLYPTLGDPMDYSLPVSSVHGIFQARILEWVAISFSRRSS